MATASSVFPEAVGPNMVMRFHFMGRKVHFSLYIQRVGGEGRGWGRGHGRNVLGGGCRRGGRGRS
jgi:hypothetical protein